MVHEEDVVGAGAEGDGVLLEGLEDAAAELAQDGGDGAEFGGALGVTGLAVGEGPHAMGEVGDVLRSEGEEEHDGTVSIICAGPCTGRWVKYHSVSMIWSGERGGAMRMLGRMTVWAAAGGLMLAMGSAGQGIGYQGGTQAEQTVQVGPVVAPDERVTKIEKGQAKLLNADRQKKLKEDTAKLLELANELKAAVTLPMPAAGALIQVLNQYLTQNKAQMESAMAAAGKVEASSAKQ